MTKDRSNPNYYTMLFTELATLLPVIINYVSSSCKFTWAVSRFTVNSCLYGIKRGFTLWPSSADSKHCLMKSKHVACRISVIPYVICGKIKMTQPHGLWCQQLCKFKSMQLAQLKPFHITAAHTWAASLPRLVFKHSQRLGSKQDNAGSI